MHKFTTPIVATDHPNGLWRRLEHSFFFWTSDVPEGLLDQYADGGEATVTDDAFKGRIALLIVPRGFVTDGASIPRIFWWFESPFGKAAKAAVVHDWCYRNNIGGRRWADRIFREALGVCGVGRVKCWIMWAAVRVGGHKAWQDRAPLDWDSRG